MKNLYEGMPNGYQDSIRKGLQAARRLSGDMSFGRGTKEERIDELREAISTADSVVIGAGAGLSTSAGLTYSGERFNRYFFDFAEEYGIRDIYYGGFYPFPEEEVKWAWWARHIYYNRYIDAPIPVYMELLEIFRDRDYFVITTNVDHQFQRAGFDKKRLFYTQGDYGLFQSVNPDIQKTYDNEEWVMAAMAAQGFVKDEDGVYKPSEHGAMSMRIPTDMIPKCPDDGSDMTNNLRSDDSFVEDEGWNIASAAYANFLSTRKNSRMLLLELGVGANTPVIVKYPFWQMTMSNEKAEYACINYGEAFSPKEIADRSICIDSDIGEALKALRKAEI